MEKSSLAVEAPCWVQAPGGQYCWEHGLWDSIVLALSDASLPGPCQALKPLLLNVFLFGKILCSAFFSGHGAQGGQRQGPSVHLQLSGPWERPVQAQAPAPHTPQPHLSHTWTQRVGSPPLLGPSLDLGPLSGEQGTQTGGHCLSLLIEAYLTQAGTGSEPRLQPCR